jgi:hypothetical protein
MKNAIVYSFYFESGNPKDSAHYGQLLYSVETLRKYNKDIPVKIFVAPSEVYSMIELKQKNVDIIGFEASAHEPMDSHVMSKRRKHRWANAYFLLESGNYDNVLYIDQDTIWQGDPQLIFDKYGNGDVIFSKSDNWEEFTDYLPLTTRPMNDGITLLSKNSLKYKDDLLITVEDKMAKWQELLRPLLQDNEHLWEAGVQYAACQYATSEYLASINKHFVEFDPMDVSMIHEYRDMPDENKDKVVVFHYLNQNYIDFVPPQYLGYLDK